MRKTKIICTLGPATDDEQILRDLILSGMDVARFNFSHGDHASHLERYRQIVRLREELGKPVGTLIDTKGPEIRLGQFEDNQPVELSTGDTYTLTTKACEGNASCCQISFAGLPADVERGTRILIDDGLVEMEVLKVTDTDITCTVLNGGKISNNKGVNVPNVPLSMPYLSERDRQDIIFGVKTGFDFIAASFVRCADDILAIRGVLEELNVHDVRIIAKIENMDGVTNIDSILRLADGIMVARGDMGVEIPFERIPPIQKKLIEKGYKAGKQVITATQMLDSMMKNPRPTRAEITDVANAIYDGTSAIMLSGETAAGAYPIEAVRTMARIAETAENDIDYRSRFSSNVAVDATNVTTAISHATVTTSNDLNAKAIITVTKTGTTARMISKYRAPAPIISCTTSACVQRQLNLSWGVIPLLMKESENTDELFDSAIEAAINAGLVESGDLVVITAGVPLGISGTTNLMKVHIVGDILVSGRGVTPHAICANVCVCQNEEEALANCKAGDILVIPHTSNNILSVIKNASGIITEQEGMNSHAAIVGLALDKPVLVGAENATKILRSGTTVTLDAVHGIVSGSQGI